MTLIPWHTAVARSLCCLLWAIVLCGCGRAGFSDYQAPPPNQVEYRYGPCGTVHPVLPASEQLRAAYYHNCVKSADGSMRCWGQGMFGQLGNETADSIGTQPNQMGVNLPPIELAAGNVQRVFAGAYNTCAMFADQRMKCWGMNSQGQLGLGDVTDRGHHAGDMGEQLPFMPLSQSATITDVYFGRYSVCALIDYERLKCWGGNQFGQLGLESITVYGDEPNELAALPDVQLGSQSIPFKIAMGFDHTCALMLNGKIKCWGGNSVGQLGLGDTEHRGDHEGEMGDELQWLDVADDYCAIDIAAGLHHTCAVLHDGRVKCWGDNTDGALGVGDVEHRGDQPGEMGTALPTVDLGNEQRAVSITAGQQFSCALLHNAQIKCWGANGYGQLGQGHIEAIGDQADEMGEKLPAVALGGAWQPTSVYAGREHVCAAAGRQIKCWGSALGLGTGDTHNRGDQPDEMGTSLPFVPLP